jgi:hypothetical protein
MLTIMPLSYFRIVNKTSSLLDSHMEVRGHFVLGPSLPASILDMDMKMFLNGHLSCTESPTTGFVNDHAIGLKCPRTSMCESNRLLVLYGSMA